MHAARGIRSAVQGFCALESAGVFALRVSLDDSFAWLVDALVTKAMGANRAVHGGHRRLGEWASANLMGAAVTPLVARPLPGEFGVIRGPLSSISKILKAAAIP